MEQRKLSKYRIKLVKNLYVAVEVQERVRILFWFRWRTVSSSCLSAWGIKGAFDRAKEVVKQLESLEGNK